MILLVRLILTLALPVFLGYGIVGLIFKNKTKVSFLERFALAWGIGIGLLGLEMFTLSLFGVLLNLKTVLIPTSLITLVLTSYLLIKKLPIFFNREEPRIHSQVPSKNLWRTTAEKILILSIGLTISYVFFDALVKPIVNFDDLWRQGCIAKIIFTTGKVITDQTLELAGPHPYLDPLSQAWIYIGIGGWNDALGKVVFALCFTGLLFIFYSGVRRYRSRFTALLFTYLLTSFPLIVYHAGTAYSDLMQTFYYTAGIIFLFHWLSSEDRPALVVSALFLGLGVFVKQLGTPLWVIAAAVLFISSMLEPKRQLKPFIQFILLSSLVALPWLINKQSFLLSNVLILWNKLRPAGISTGLPAAINAPYGPPTLAGILQQLGRRMFFYADWQILWFVLSVSLVLCWQKVWRSKLKYLVLIILLNLLMMTYGFTEQNAYNFLVDGTLVQRMLMYQVPVALFLAALCLGQEKEKCL